MSTFTLYRGARIPLTVKGYVSGLPDPVGKHYANVKARIQECLETLKECATTRNVAVMNRTLKVLGILRASERRALTEDELRFAGLVPESEVQEQDARTLEQLLAEKE